MAGVDLSVADGIVGRLRTASYKDREGIKEELLAWGQAHNSETVRQHLEELKKGLSLEVKWEIDEVLEALRPPPAAPPEEPPAEEPPKDQRLRMSDLEDIYADPYGTVILRDKKTKSRWFVQQVHPQTGQPVVGELTPAEIEQVKGQLKGSPYWRLGAGVA